MSNEIQSLLYSLPDEEEGMIQNCFHYVLTE